MQIAAPAVSFAQIQLDLVALRGTEPAAGATRQDADAYLTALSTSLEQVVAGAKALAERAGAATAVQVQGVGLLHRYNKVIDRLEAAPLTDSDADKLVDLREDGIDLAKQGDFLDV